MTGGPAAESTPVEDSEGATPEEVFQQLGNETRVATLRTLAAAGPCSFSTLFDASEEDTSAGFAYHLRQLDQFVRQREDERWELTAAGREAVRLIRAGTFTVRVDRDAVSLPESCPRCEGDGLTLAVTDSLAEVTCTGCDESVSTLSVPPGGVLRGKQAVPETVDAYHRHRVRTFADGVCPDCGGAVETTVGSLTDAEHAEEPDQVQVQFACERCEVTLDCPVTVAVLDHPAVVSFYDDHDADPDARPVWNVGSEWREHLVSTDPWCLLVSSRLDQEVLDLYVDERGDVQAHDRRTVTTASVGPGDARSGDDPPVQTPGQDGQSTEPVRGLERVPGRRATPPYAPGRRRRRPIPGRLSRRRARTIAAGRPPRASPAPVPVPSARPLRPRTRLRGTREAARCPRR